jgi:hypothetical protein
VPPVRPSGAILRQLESLPTGWTAFAAGAPAALSTATLAADLGQALAAAWVAKLTAAAPATLTRSKALAKAVNDTVRNAALAASTNAVRAFLSAEITPVLQTSVTALTTAVGHEVDLIMKTPAGTLAAGASKDPAIAALASSMKTQLETAATAAKAAQAGAAGTTPVNPGATAPAQQVTFGTANIMSDNRMTFRIDQFTAIADKFNTTSGLRRDREDPFRPELV